MGIGISTKNLIIDEEIYIENENERIYTGRLELTQEDMTKINKIITEQNKNTDMADEEFTERAEKNQKEFEKIAFKNQKADMLKAGATEYQINLLVDETYFFILEVIVKPRINKISSMTSKLPQNMRK